MGYDFELSDCSSVVHPTQDEDGLILAVDGQRVRATLSPTMNDGEFILELDGRREVVFAACRGDVHFVHFRGRARRVEAINALERAQREAAPSGSEEFLRAPMPGVVVEVVVETGAEVESGQLLMTIESMKLQTAIVAPHAARVAELFLATGASFEQGAALVRLEALDEAEDEGQGESE
jgi:3-methylcrotonyl-CoA carboxylase alpha subunit